MLNSKKSVSARHCQILVFSGAAGTVESFTPVAKLVPATSQLISQSSTPQLQVSSEFFFFSNLLQLKKIVCSECTSAKLEASINRCCCFKSRSIFVLRFAILCLNISCSCTVVSLGSI